MTRLKEFEPDPPLSEQQLAFVRSFSEETVASIDSVLLAQVSERWRKVAMIVALAIEALENRLGGMPDVYLAQRVRHLVECGQLEAQGDLSRMRFSEVRRPVASWK